MLKTLLSLSGLPDDATSTTSISSFSTLESASASLHPDPPVQARFFVSAVYAMWKCRAVAIDDDDDDDDLRLAKGMSSSRRMEHFSWLQGLHKTSLIGSDICSVVNGNGGWTTTCYWYHGVLAWIHFLFLVKKKIHLCRLQRFESIVRSIFLHLSLLRS